MSCYEITWPPRSAPHVEPEQDDAPALRLLTAVCELARRDANAGDATAAAWLADLAERRPARVRVAQVEPVEAPQAAAPRPRRPPRAYVRPSAAPGTIAARALPLAEAAGFPGRLRVGAAPAIAEALGVHPVSVRNALSGLRRELAAAGD